MQDQQNSNIKQSDQKEDLKEINLQDDNDKQKAEVIQNPQNIEKQEIIKNSQGKLTFDIKQAVYGKKCCCCTKPIAAPDVVALTGQLGKQQIAIKQYIFLYNPASANGECQSNVNKLVSFCKKNNVSYQLIQSKSLEHFRETIANFDYSQNEDFLFICGGDGSIFHAVNSLAEKKNIRIGVMPFGSGNDFARSLNLFKINFLQKFEQIVKSPMLYKIDIIKVKLIDSKGGFEIKYFHANFGYGYPGRVNDTANKKFQCFKGLRYKVAALHSIFQFKDDIVTLEIDNKYALQNQPVKFLMAFNSQYTGGGMRLGPYSQIDDGLIDIVLMRIHSRCQFLKSFDAAQQNGLCIYLDGVEYYKGKTVKIFGQVQNALELDGETFFAKDIELSIVQDMISVIC